MTKYNKKVHKSAFSDNIRELFSSSPHSKSSLAKALNVSHTTVSRWLDGQIPKGDSLFGLASLLGVNVQWLLHGEGPKDAVREKEAEDELQQQALTKNAELRKAAIEAGLESEIEAMAEQYKNYLYQFPSINSRVREMFKQNIADNISQFEKWCDEVKPSKD